MTYFNQLSKTKQKIYKKLNNPSIQGVELVYLMEMGDHYYKTVNLLKEFEFCSHNFKTFNKNNELIERIKFLLNENGNYEQYEQWRRFYECDDIYDIYYLKNSLNLL